jgi:hypothetical protein
MELANQLATSFDILVMIDTLGKTRNTQQQKRLITLVDSTAKREQDPLQEVKSLI